MRGSRIKFGFKQRFHPTPKKIIRFAKSLKRLLSALALLSFATTSTSWSIFFVVMLWITDEVPTFFGEEQSLDG